MPKIKTVIAEHDKSMSQVTPMGWLNQVVIAINLKYFPLKIEVLLLIVKYHE